MRCDPEGVVEAAMTAYVLGDFETAAAYYAPDATFAMYADDGTYPFAGEWRGRAEIVDCWRKIDAAFDLVRFEMRNMRSAGNEVVFQIDYELLHASSGEVMDGIARIVIEVADGRIVREREYNDVERIRAFLRLCDGQALRSSGSAPDGHEIAIDLLRE